MAAEKPEKCSSSNPSILEVALARKGCIAFLSLDPIPENEHALNSVCLCAFLMFEGVD